MQYLGFSVRLIMIVFGLGGSVSAEAAASFKGTYITADQSESAIHWTDLAIDDSDRIHLIWVSPAPSSIRQGKVDHHLFYRRADPHDSTLSVAVHLTNTQFRVDGLPAISCNSAGRTAIVAYVYDYVHQFNGSVLWTLGPEQLIPELPVRLGMGEEVQGHCGLADVDVADDGRIIVAYETPGIPDSSGKLGTTVWYEMFDPQGRQILPPTAVGSRLYEYSRAANPSISVNRSGRFAIAWNAELLDNEKSFPEQVFARIYDSTGTPLTDEVLVSCEGTSGTCQGDTSIFRAGPAGKNPAIATSDEGGVAIVFRNTRYFECSNEYFVLRLLRPDGSPRAAMQKVNDLTECGAPAFPASLAFGGDGNLLVAWTNNNVEGTGAQSNNAYYQVFDKTGVRLGGNERIDTQSSSSSSDCDWRVGCDINRNGHAAISTICRGQDRPRQLLLLTIQAEQLGRN